MLMKKYRRLEGLTDRLIYVLERINLTSYIEYLENTNRLLWNNFLIGLARGLGTAIGFSLLGAVVVYVIIESGALGYGGIKDYIQNMLK